MRDWNTLARNREARLARAAALSTGKVVAAADAGALLERVLEAGDRVCLEGNNQKQADFLAKVLAALDPAVMGWTPPDGICVPRWWCRPTT